MGIEAVPIFGRMISLADFDYISAHGT